MRFKDFNQENIRFHNLPDGGIGVFIMATPYEVFMNKKKSHLEKLFQARLEILFLLLKEIKKHGTGIK